MWRVLFYQTSSGREPAREFLRDRPKEDRAKVGALLTELQSGQRMGMPYARYLGKKLWELRVIGKEGHIRVIYFTPTRECIYILHGFIKKTAKMPEKDWLLAMARKRNIEKSEGQHEK